jgi:hypothetical protein
MCDLSERTDVCKIYNCVDKVEGIRSNSVSPTDTWIINFKKGTQYDKQNLQYGFFKVFLNSFTVSTLSKPYSNVLPRIIGLEYEILVYKNIIKPLINYNVCPNFVRYLASGNNCTYNDLFNMLNKNTGLSAEKIKECLNRNINCMKKDCGKRFAINKYVPRSYFRSDIADLYIDTTEIPNSYKFNIILNERLPLKSVTLDAWLVTNKDIENIWYILFQICAACYSMSLCKMTHNDLHLGNIFIEERDDIEKIVYIINNKKYILYTRYKVFIFDFDRSYCQNLGDNIINPINNIFIDNIDIIEVLCEVSNYIDNSMYKCKIANAICKSVNQAEYISKKGIKRCFLRENYNNYNSSIQILENIGSYLPDITLKRKVIMYVYVCNSEAFSDGFFNYEIQKKIYTETLKIIDIIPNGIGNKFPPLLEYNIKSGKCQRISGIKYDEEKETDTSNIFSSKSFFKSPGTFKKYIYKTFERKGSDEIENRVSFSPEKLGELSKLLSDISPIKPRKKRTSLDSTLSSIPENEMPRNESDISGIFAFDESEEF